MRAAVRPGELLKTPTGRGTFIVAGTPEKDSSSSPARTRRGRRYRGPPWRRSTDLLPGRSWVRIGSPYSTDAAEGTLDAHLKRFLARATAGWVAVVLERAGVLESDSGISARVRLGPGC